MKKLVKVSIGILLSLVLTLPLPMTVPFQGVGVAPITAIAATIPAVKESNVTLYVGYKIYQIELKNLYDDASLDFKSCNSKVARVSNTGIITPVKKGITTVTVTIRQGGNKYTSKIKVTVDNPNIELTSKTSSLNIGETFTYKAKANGAIGSVEWSVSDNSIASINSKNGKLTAKKAGEVEVVATAGNISVSYPVKVNRGMFTTDTKDIVCSDQKIIYITTHGMDDDDSIIFNIKNKDILSCKWGKFDGDVIALVINPNKVGSTTITIKSKNTDEQLILNVKVVKDTNGRTSDAKELSAKEIYAKCAPATVELQITTYDGEAIGSGFFIRSGILVTNYHVIEGANKIQVETYDGKLYDAQYILGYDKDYDIAILSIDAATEYLTLNKGDISVGETVYALGSPRGLTGSLSQGIVSSASRIYNNVEYIQTTAPISAGNSGGPLINAYGEVIGINDFILLDSQNLNFALNVFQISKVNLDSTIKAEDFYASNKEAEPARVNEDSSKSSSPYTAQLIASNTIVSGSLSQSNIVDAYHINLTQEGEIVAVCQPTDKENFNDLNFVITDLSGNKVADSTAATSDGSQYLALSSTLPAGDYYILVYSDSNYLNNPLDYMFYVTY